MGQAEEVWTENKKSGEVLHPLKAKAARCWLHRFQDFAHAIDSHGQSSSGSSSQTAS